MTLHLTPKDKLVLQAIQHYAPNGNFFASNAALKDYIECFLGESINEKTIRRALLKLQGLNIIQRKDKCKHLNGKWTWNYKLHHHFHLQPKNKLEDQLHPLAQLQLDADNLFPEEQQFPRPLQNRKNGNDTVSARPEKTPTKEN